MKKAVLIITMFLLSILTIPQFGNMHLQAAPTAPEAATPTDPNVPGLGIITSRTMENGRIATSNQGIFGPDSCAHMGDPYSPLSNGGQGPYTYTYRIFVPSDYPHDVVRVELFDPDSINTTLNNVTIARTNLAINEGLGATDPKSCGSDGGSANRWQPCLLETDELGLVGTNSIELDQINPFWFVRLDENRRPPSTPGGNCGAPAAYTPSLNTQTRYTLAYFAQAPGSSPTKIQLVTYFGQTGDGVRDSGDHQTDLHWVSPGAAVPFSNVDGPGVPVPAISQQPGVDSFEINLNTDVPNIVVDSDTGARYLYLDVQAMSGASENGYEIWAGPPVYTNIIPSEVNERNLHLLNNPGAHDSQGVEVTAVNTLVQNSNFDNPVDIPLTTIGPEMAGQTIEVRLFDSDSGAQPPIVFYFDTLGFTPADANPLGFDPAQTDWALAFAVAGQADPDGVAEGVRCTPGNCDNQWIDPAYEIAIPGDLSSCDWQNPTQDACTPFYGGRLMARYDGSLADTYAWELSLTTGNDPIDPTTGCSAFPIGIQTGARSVTPPGTGSNPYPNAGDFTYPTNPPIYQSFLNHRDDIPLRDAATGDVFRVQNGSGNGDFGFLVWNTGIAANANTLANSLTWPGDATDYTNQGDPGTAVPGSGFGHVVRGYIEPGDPTDQTLHIGDWIAGSTGSINASAVQAQLAAHIDLGRTLRLPIWDNVTGSGSDPQYQIAQFAIFRVIGYNATNSWLLLEFIDHDTSCGQPPAAPVAPVSVAIAGPTEGSTETSYGFTATVTPGDTTTPVTYTWEITDQDTITNTGGISNTVMVEWSSAGSKMVTVTAVNSSGTSVSQSHTIDIALPDKILYLPLITNNTPN